MTQEFSRRITLPYMDMTKTYPWTRIEPQDIEISLETAFDDHPNDEAPVFIRAHVLNEIKVKTLNRDNLPRLCTAIFRAANAALFFTEPYEEPRPGVELSPFRTEPTGTDQDTYFRILVDLDDPFDKDRSRHLPCLIYLPATEGATDDNS